MITCNPWKPVATKNVVPYTESAIVKDASIYSKPCKAVNITPKITVNNNPKIVFFLSPVINAWCDHVTVAPLVNKIAVFNNGISNGLNVCIPTGGHTDPNAISGPNALW